MPFSLDSSGKAVPAQATMGVLAADVVDFHGSRLPSSRQRLIFFTPSSNQGISKLYSTLPDFQRFSIPQPRVLSMHAHHQIPTSPTATRTPLHYVCLGDI